jgi:nucleoside-diphosphate-sugar epimerase
MKKFLILGAAGMVGRTIIENIANNYNEDIEVFALDRFTETLIPFESKNVHVLLNDCLEDVLQSNIFDCMLQLAFPRNVRPEQWADGIQFCMEAMFLAHKYTVKRVVHVSSQSLYGWDRENVATIDQTVKLVSPYTTGKFCTEVLVNNLFADRPHTNVRLSTIIGPYTKERVVNKFFEKIIQGENLIIQGGEQIFSFLDIRDAANGLLTIMNDNSDSWKSVYNLGTSEFANLKQIAQSAINIGKHNGYSQSQVILEPMDITLNNKIDVSDMLTDFGWDAKYKLEDTMNYIFKSLLSNRHGCNKN